MSAQIARGRTEGGMEKRVIGILHGQKGEGRGGGKGSRLEYLPWGNKTGTQKKSCCLARLGSL